MRLASLFLLTSVIFANGNFSATLNAPTAKTEWWQSSMRSAYEKYDSPDIKELYLGMSSSSDLTTVDDKTFRLTVDRCVVEGTLKWDKKKVRFIPATVDGKKVSTSPQPPSMPGARQVTREYFSKLYKQVSKPFEGDLDGKNHIYLVLSNVAIAFERGSAVKKTVTQEEKSVVGYWQFPAMPSREPGEHQVKGARLVLWPDNYFSYTYPLAQSGTWRMKNGLITFKQIDEDKDFPLPSARLVGGKLELALKNPARIVTLTKEKNLP